VVRSDLSSHFGLSRAGIGIALAERSVKTGSGMPLSPRPAEYHDDRVVVSVLGMDVAEKSGDMPPHDSDRPDVIQRLPRVVFHAENSGP